MAWHVLSAALLFPTAGLGDDYQPSNTAQSFPTLEQAEAALRAAYPGAADLTFERILSETPTHSVRLYALPTVAPNPPAWSDWCNVAGDYASGQAVCDARRAITSWPNLLSYVETDSSGSAGNGEGYRGECQDLTRNERTVLGYPQRWRSCPSTHPFPKNITGANTCGGTHPPQGGGPDLACGKSLVSLTETITVTRTSCPVDALTPLEKLNADLSNNDPDTLALEQNPINTERLDPRMKPADRLSGYLCLKEAIESAGVPFNLTSAFRTDAYQRHLHEIWNKWKEFDDLTPEEIQACQSRKKEIKDELDKHGLGGLHIPPAKKAGKHPQGLAIDVSRRTTMQQLEARFSAAVIKGMAGRCNLTYPFPKLDRGHFEYKLAP